MTVLLNQSQVVFDESRCYYQIRRKNGKHYASERCSNERVGKGIYCDEHIRLVKGARMGAAHALAWGGFL